MRVNVLAVFQAVLCFLFASCVAGNTVRKLPTYDECMAITPVAAMKCVWGSETPVEELPCLIPFATIYTVGNDQRFCMKTALDKATLLHPDVLYMGDQTSVYAGSVATYTAGSVFSHPTYNIGMSTCCYRLSPVSLGFVFDGDGMVVAIEAETRKSGLLEGDNIVSFAGSPISKGDAYLRSPHYRKMLKMKPGDEATLVWIRPGSGRMEGKIRCLPNPPKHLDLKDAVLEETPGRDPSRYGDGY